MENFSKTAELEVSGSDGIIIKPKKPTEKKSATDADEGNDDEQDVEEALEEAMEEGEEREDLSISGTSLCQKLHWHIVQCACAAS